MLKKLQQVHSKHTTEGCHYLMIYKINDYRSKKVAVKGEN